MINIDCKCCSTHGNIERSPDPSKHMKLATPCSHASTLGPSQPWPKRLDRRPGWFAYRASLAPVEEAEGLIFQQKCGTASWLVSQGQVDNLLVAVVWAFLPRHVKAMAKAQSLAPHDGSERPASVNRASSAECPETMSGGEEKQDADTIDAVETYATKPSTTTTTTTIGGKDLEDGQRPRPQPQLSRKKPLSFYLGFTCLLVMVLLVSLDSTCMAVSISTISEELNGTTFEAFWANLAYMLADVVTLPLYASASDVLGRKLPLYTAFVFAVCGSIVFARAHSMQMVIVGRLIQGLGGGGLDALVEVLIVDITTLKERPLFLGMLTMSSRRFSSCSSSVLLRQSLSLDS